MGLIILLGATGISCTSDHPAEREYALPDTLCSLAVDRDLYADLFPPGSELEARGGPNGDSWSYLCSYWVDGDVAVYVEVAPGGSGDINDLFITSEGKDMSEGEEIAGDYETVVWPHAAAARGDCEQSEEETGVEQGSDQHAVILEATYPEGDEESAALLRGLIGPLVEADRERLGCR